ncbi:DUF2637 domain-containing protein [Actinomycetes bacterium KLBMP 9759]
MTSRGVLYALLGIVAAAAAVLSFSALRDLALVCGFAPQLAWLLPVVVDAGAAAGSLVWLGGQVAATARTFARTLALSLLGLSVAANALGHGLAAFGLAPAWWVVVIVSSVAPAVLGSVVHLAVLVGRPIPEPAAGPDMADDDEPIPYELTADAYTAGQLDEHGLSRLWEIAPPARSGADRAAELIAQGAGRRRLSRELGVTEYEARQILARTRTADEQLSLNDHSFGEPVTASPSSNGVRS